MLVFDKTRSSHNEGLNHEEEDDDDDDALCYFPIEELQMINWTLLSAKTS